VCFNDEEHKVRLSLRQADILAALAANESLQKAGGGVPDINKPATKSVKPEESR